MALLGVLVGKGATSVDSWFQQLGATMGAHREDLLVVTYPPLVALVLVAVLVVTIRRRDWPSTAMLMVCPALAIGLVQLLKRVFGREKGGALAYPSGHTTFLIVVLALAVVVVGVAGWSLALATVLGVLGAFGQAVTYHYFTDTIGAALLATSLVALAAQLTGYASRGRREIAAPPRPSLNLDGSAPIDG